MAVSSTPRELDGGDAGRAGHDEDGRGVAQGTRTHAARPCESSHENACLSLRVSCVAEDVRVDQRAIVLEGRHAAAQRCDEHSCAGGRRRVQQALLLGHAGSRTIV